MIAVFIAIFLVLLIMIYFITVSIQIVVEHSTRKVNTYFAKKLDEFDLDFKEKLDKLNELEEEKVTLENNIKLLELDRANLKESRFYKPRPIIRDIYIPTARYIDNEFFEDYKMTKNLLIINKEEMIRTVMEKFPYKKNRARYIIAKNIISELNFDNIYDLVTMDSINQLEGLYCIFGYDSNGMEKTGSVVELDMIKEYVDTLAEVQDFDILDFIKYVERIRDEQTPILTAYTGEQEMDFTNISREIESEYDSNICEGIRIIYQNRVYDYSMYQSRKRTKG